MPRLDRSADFGCEGYDVPALRIGHKRLHVAVESMMPVEGEDNAAQQCNAVPRAAPRSHPATQDRRHRYRGRFFSIAWKCFQLRHVDGDGELAATTMGDAVHLTIAIQKLLAGNAQRAFERCGRVVNAGMNHLAVARTGVHAELPLALGDDHRRREPVPAGDRQVDDAGADHHALRLAQRRSTALAAAMNSSTSAPAVA